MEQIRGAALSNVWGLSHGDTCDPPPADSVSGCFLEGIPRVTPIAIWKSCLRRVLSERNVRPLLSVKLIMLQSSECLGALNPESSADFM